MRLATLAVVDWRLAPGRMAREAALRLALLFVLALLLSALVHTGGLDRYLSERWVVTAVLRLHVPPAQGEGLAERLRSHGSVRRAEFHDAEAAWRETVAAYPGIEALRSEGGANPVPGYLELRLRPGRLTPEDVRSLEGTLAAVPQVEKVILGSGSLPSLFRARDAAGVALWALLALLALPVAALFAAQEGARASDLHARLLYLAERGTEPAALARGRAAGAALGGLALGVAALLLAAPCLYLLARLPALAPLLAPASDVADAFVRLPVLLFPAAVALLSGACSLLGGRAARSRHR